MSNIILSKNRDINKCLKLQIICMSDGLLSNCSHMFTRNEVTSGRRLAMNHRLSGIISIEHSIFRNLSMQSGWVISRLAGCTNRASNYLHYICKRSSTSEQAIICFGVRTQKQNTRAPSENVNKTQDCDIWNFKTENFIISIQFYTSKV